MIYYLKYSGFSCDGRGPTIFNGVTEDIEEVKSFLKIVDKSRPYGWGHIIVADENGEVERWNYLKDAKQ